MTRTVWAQPHSQTQSEQGTALLGQGWKQLQGRTLQPGLDTEPFPRAPAPRSLPIPCHNRHILDHFPFAHWHQTLPGLQRGHGSRYGVFGQGGQWDSHAQGTHRANQGRQAVLC